jgi:hypothetical protein
VSVKLSERGGTFVSSRVLSLYLGGAADLYKQGAIILNITLIRDIMADLQP